MEDAKISRFWWLWLPLIVMLVQFGLEASLDSATLARLMSENGPHELLQALIAGAAFIVALLMLWRFPVRARPWLTAWVVLAALCCFYVTGEELSWGQQIFHWVTPGYWDHLNDQHETNLHNTSAWLDQKPRLLLEIGILVGGLLIPLARKCRPSLLPPRFAIIYPPSILAVVAGIDAFFKFSNMLAKLFHVILYERVSEVQELYMFYFVLLYLIILRRRIFPKAASSRAPAEMR